MKLFFICITHKDKVKTCIFILYVALSPVDLSSIISVCVYLFTVFV